MADRSLALGRTVQVPKSRIGNHCTQATTSVGSDSASVRGQGFAPLVTALPRLISPRTPPCEPTRRDLPKAWGSPHRPSSGKGPPR
jgi:hypothetical protein